MNLPKFVDFVEQNRESLHANSYVIHPDFTELYIRMTKRLLSSKWYPCLDIARVMAKSKGEGAFKNLIFFIRSNYPKLAIYIESVLTERFATGLVKMGFTKFNQNCFYLLPLEES